MYDSSMKINYCARSLLAADPIYMFHRVFMYFYSTPKQISYKTNSFRQEQNRGLWRKTHCRSDTLLAIKEWPHSWIPAVTLSLFSPLSQRIAFHWWCKKWQKQTHPGSLRNNRNSFNSLGQKNKCWARKKRWNL